MSGSELKLIHAARFRDFHLKNGNDLGFKKILYTDYTVIIRGVWIFGSRILQLDSAGVLW